MTVVQSWGQAILTAFTNALNLLLTFIPRLLGFLVILLVGWLVATAVSKALTFLLRKVGFDRLANRIGLTRIEQNMGIQLDTASILGKIAYWFIFITSLSGYPPRSRGGRKESGPQTGTLHTDTYLLVRVQPW